MIPVKLSERFCIAKITIHMIMLLFVAMQASVFAEEGVYRVQIGEVYENLDEVNGAIRDLRNETLVCITDGVYRVVHKNSGDIETANALKADLEARLPSQKMSLVQLDGKQCFPAAGFPGIQTREDTPWEHIARNQIQNKTQNQTENKTRPSPRTADTSRQPIRVNFPLNYGNSKAGKKAGPPPAAPHGRTVALPDTVVRVLPEVTTKISVSNRDVNRITCMGGRQIRDIIFSTEKGLTTKIHGSNAFLKFKVVQDANTLDTRLMTDPAEIFVVCGSEGTIYTLITEPMDIPAQTIQLVSNKDRVKENLLLFQGLALEEKIIRIMREAYRGEFPDTYTVKPVVKSLDHEFDIRISRPDRNVRISAGLTRIVEIDGEGLRLKEYRISLPDADDEVNITEKDFLLPELSERPIGIVLDSLTVKKDRATRLFVLEQPASFDAEERL